MKALFDKLSAQCSKMTTQHYSTSFSLGIYFLNRRLREPIYAIYGFVRLADEIVDSFHGYNKRLLLKKFSTDCFEAIEAGISLNPVLNSFQETVNRYSIDRELIQLFLNSMEMDLEHSEYTDLEYNEYILGSAQVVGLMCLKVFTEGNLEQYERLKTGAMRLGSAFQKVNFLRDIKADYKELSRTYFPDVNLTNFSVVDKKKIEADIEQEFAAGLAGIRQLPRAAKSGVYLAYLYYKELFNKIKKATPENVMTARIRISNGHKVGLMCDSIIRYKLNAL